MNKKITTFQIALVIGACAFVLSSCSGPSGFLESRFGPGLSAVASNGKYEMLWVGGKNNSQVIPAMFLRAPDGKKFQMDQVTPELLARYEKLMRSTDDNPDGIVDRFEGPSITVQFRDGKLVEVYMSEGPEWAIGASEDGEFVTLKCPIATFHRVFGEPTAKETVPVFAP